jgi:hypothetical protein
VIHVARRPEPSDFDERVRKPGHKFLKSCPNPTQRQWNSHSYWRRMLHALYTEYKGICAYSCHWIPYDTGADTIEHFKPKSKYPLEGYEWQNYRLVCQLLNSRKGNDEDIIDPFLIRNGWFIIDFPALLVKPAHGLKKALHERVKKTCDVLGLNDDATCMMMRQEFVTEYCLNNINYAHIEKRAPFLALQMKEQGYDDLPAIQKVMKIYPTTR